MECTMCRNPTPSDLTDASILETAIRDIQDRIERTKDEEDLKWLYDRLFKAIALRRKTTNTRKGRGFDLS